LWLWVQLQIPPRDYGENLSNAIWPLIKQMVEECIKDYFTLDKALKVNESDGERHKMAIDLGIISKIPGPPAIPILGTTYMFKWKVEELVEQFFEYFHFYALEGIGAINLWLGPQPLVILIKADYVKAVLESNALTSKGKEYSILEPWLGTGLLTSSGSKWKNRRKLLTPAFHFNILNSFMLIHDQEAQIFIDQLELNADTDQIFDIYLFVKRCALDIICETAMSTKVNAQKDHSHPYVKAVHRMNELSFLFARMPLFWLKPVWYASGYGKEYDQTLLLVKNFTKKVIEERRLEFRNHEYDVNSNKTSENSNKRYAFLDLLLSLYNEGKLSIEDIQEEVDTFMFEGHDTTSSGIGWTLWLLAHYPEYQEKVIQEVDAVFGNSDRSCTSEDIKDLRYLDQCLKESHRLFPPSPLNTRSVEDDFEYEDLFIPRGATVVISPLMLHRSIENWKNPNEFNPENFSPDNITKLHPFAFIPFSAGPRNCIGNFIRNACNKKL
uniref:Cytochrome P450 n=1 Tax=Acrobeloides nanus TaxID=290746 RepID=A0A914EP75_9BILA